MKLVGDLGLRNYYGLLVLIVPAAVAEAVRQGLAEEIASNEAAGPRFVEGLGGGGFVAEFAAWPQPRMHKAVSPGMGLESGRRQGGVRTTEAMPGPGTAPSSRLDRPRSYGATSPPASTSA